MKERLYISDTNNARNLSPTQVAKTFVPPPFFSTLCKLQNSIIVGPRGSGKTTLLKMLTPAALSNWNSAVAGSAVPHLEFRGIYIPGDILFYTQIQPFTEDARPTLAINEKPLSEPPEIIQLLAESALAAHSLKSFVRTIIDCVPRYSKQHRFYKLDMPETAEWALSTSLAHELFLKLQFPSLDGVLLALEGRLARIGMLFREYSLRGNLSVDAVLTAIPYVTMNFLEILRIFDGVLNAHVKLRPRPWALMFDEQETAPLWLRNFLFRCMRTGCENFIFKISMAPVSSKLPHPAQSEADLGGESVPRQKDDYDLVPLWFTSKTEIEAFTHRLFKSVVLDKLGTHATIPTPHDVFGETPQFTFRTDPSGTKIDKYEIGSQEYEVICALYESDSGFKRYIDRQFSSLEELFALNHELRAAKLRKMYPVALWRKELRRPTLKQDSSDKDGLRSRKVLSELYSGFQAVFAALEGNPRWFISAFEDMLLAATGGQPRRISTSPENRSLGGRISPEIQARVLVENAKFVYHFTQLMDPKAVQLLDKVALAIKARLLGERFIPDLPGHFIIDPSSSISDHYRVANAVNSGAANLLESELQQLGPIDVATFVGARIRLSYLLCCYYRLPFRIGEPRALSGLLRESFSLLSSENLSLDFQDESQEEPTE